LRWYTRIFFKLVRRFIFCTIIEHVNLKISHESIAIAIVLKKLIACVGDGYLASETQILKVLRSWLALYLDTYNPGVLCSLLAHTETFD
jgi:hypothetical protein